MGKLREARLGPGEACLAAPNVSTCLLTGDKQRCVDFSLYDVNSSDWTVKNPKVLNGQIVVSGFKISRGSRAIGGANPLSLPYFFQK